MAKEQTSSAPVKKEKTLKKGYVIGSQRYEKGTPWSKELEDKIKAQGGHSDKCFK